jgi:hypothetical protein
VPLEPGSGRYAVEAGGRTLRWDPFADPAAPLAALADRLRALLAEARGHPLAAVRLDVAHAIEFRFTALGSEPVGLTVSDLRARVVASPSPPSDPPPLAWVREAAAVGAELPVAVGLEGGEHHTLRASLTPAAPARVDGFARVALDLAAVGEAKVEATLAAGPA